MANNPQDFTEAFWAINTLQVFQDDGQGGSNATNASEGSVYGGAGGSAKVRRSQAAASRSRGRVLPMYL